MIVVEIPLKDVRIDVENELDLGTVSEEEAILHLTQAYDFLPAPLTVTVANGIATEAQKFVITHNRITLNTFEI